MKTILSIILFLLTVFQGFGQSNSETNPQDSVVTIPLTVAHNIQRKLVDCDLLQQQYNQIQLKVSSLEMIILQTEGKVEDYKRFTLKLESEYKKKKRQGFMLKLAVPAALIGGFVLGSQ